MWETFIVLYEMICHNGFYVLKKQIKDLDMNTKIDLPVDIKEVITKGRSNADYEELRGKVLEALGPGLVPYIYLVGLICGGKMEDLCFQCKSSLKVDHIKSLVPIKVVHDNDSSVRQGVVTVTLLGNFFSCKMKDCYVKMKKLVAKQQGIIITTITMLYHKYSNYRCDFCHNLGPGMPRCSACMTKLYCQRECVEGDYLVHRNLCGSETAVWKKKEGEKKRREESKELLDEWKEKIKVALSGFPDYEHVLKFTLEKLD